MPALNFRARYVEPILAGTKIHTLRQMRRDGRDPAPGDELALYTGMRTKQCRLLERVTITAVRDCRLWIATDLSALRVELDGHALEPGVHPAFAVNDGFASVRELAEFFAETYPEDWTDPPIRGLLIQWGETPY